MKRFTICVVLLGFIVVSLLIVRPALTDQQSEKKTAEQTSLEQMQKERIEALEKAVEIRKETYKVGASTFPELSKAQDDLIEAKLEATTQADERIAVLEKQLKVTQGVFDYIENCHKAGFGKNSEIDYLQAKAHRLSITIKIAREQTHKKM